MASMNRFDRVTTTLIQLQTRKITKAQDLAQRFGISLRTVYRDIRSLETAGVPIYGEAGLGYSLVEGYRLPPIMFTREEAASLITAEKLVERLTGSQTRADYKAALYKIKAVLRTHDREFLESLEESIAVRKGPPDPEADQPDCLPAILRGLSERKVLSLDYRAPNQAEAARRKVEPVGVFFDNANWHLYAFCRLRKDYRDFRLDRISGLTELKETFPNRHPPLDQVLDQANRDKRMETVVLSVGREAAEHLKRAKYYRGFVSETEKDGRIEMHFLTASLEDFAHWYATFAEYARIVSPQAFRDRVKSLLAKKAAQL